MKPVGHFYEHYTDVGRHGEKEFSEILGLERGFVSEYPAGNLCETFHYVGNFLSESGLNVFTGEFSVFHHVMQKSGAYRC